MARILYNIDTTGWPTKLVSLIKIAKADGMGFMVYLCYNVVDTTVKDVEIYKGTKIKYPEPVTEAPTTEAAKTEPLEEPHTEDAAGSEVEEPAASGCGASVGAMGMALVAVIGTGAVVASRKRRG